MGTPILAIAPRVLWLALDWPLREVVAFSVAAGVVLERCAEDCRRLAPWRFDAPRAAL
jgi:hypothetical protein